MLLPDLLIPVRDDSVEDAIAVLMNPGSPNFDPERDVYFVRTLDDLRHMTPADVDGDGISDLLVACEGQPDEEHGDKFANKVHILRGDPDQAAGFSEFEPRCILDGFEVLENACGGCEGDENQCDDKPEVEFVATDAEFRQPGEQIRFILASGDRNVFVYTNRTTEPGKPVFDRARHVHQGVDPETLYITNIFGEDNPDFVMVDEDAADQDRFILWRFESFDEVGHPNWTKKPVSDLSGAPAEFKVFDRPEPVGGMNLAMTIRGSTNLEMRVFSRSDPGKLELLDSIAVEVPRVGTRMGSALSDIVNRERFWATIVEDRDPGTNLAAIDIVSIPAEVTAAGLHCMGSADGEFLSTKLKLVADDLRALVWGEFGGSGVDDLLVVDVVAKEDDDEEDTSVITVYHDLGMKLLSSEETQSNRMSSS